jgi:hypothetical protein
LKGGDFYTRESNGNKDKNQIGGVEKKVIGKLIERLNKI